MLNVLKHGVRKGLIVSEYSDFEGAVNDYIPQRSYTLCMNASLQEMQR
jgi:hypothetical protein